MSQIKLFLVRDEGWREVLIETDDEVMDQFQEPLIIKTGFSDETRAKMSEAHKGRTVSDETRAKMSEAHKGYWQRRKVKQQDTWDTLPLVIPLP